MKHVKLTQSAKVLSNFLVLRSWWGENCTTNLAVVNEEIIQNLRVKTEETIATLERKDEDVYCGFRPENRRWAETCAVDEIKLNRVLTDYFVNSFPWIKG